MVITPSRFLLMIASPKDFTMAANSRDRCSVRLYRTQKTATTQMARIEQLRLNRSALAAAGRGDEEGQDGEQRASDGGNPYRPQPRQPHTGPDHGDVERRRRPALGHSGIESEDQGRQGDHNPYDDSLVSWGGGHGLSFPRS